MRTMNTLLAIASLFSIVLVSGALALGYPYDDEFSSWRLARQSRRSHHCSGSGSKCFSSSQCCQDFVCAAFDDYFGSGPRRQGMKPEVPGYCVKEKTLQMCYSSRDCGLGAKCVPLGRGGELYCIDRESLGEQAAQEPIVSAPGPQLGYRTGGSGNAGYGARCSASSECKSYDKSGNALCCQNVKQGRAGKRQLCDRVNELSQCL